MLQRPTSTLVQEQHFTKPAAMGGAAGLCTANGATQAAKDLFATEPVVADPQMDAPVSLGTTIIAVAFDGGVVLAADSRTSTGTYVVNRTSNKLTRLQDNIYCCRSGSAADTQALAEMISNYLDMQSLETGRPMPVASAAALFQKLCYMNKWNISAGIIVAGFDEINGGTVFSIPSGGSCVKLPYAMGGSGSVFLYSFMDSNFREGMSKDECLSLCRRAVAHALSRDGSSGGVVRTMCLTAEGAEHTTTPWTAIPYCMERDPQHAKQALVNQPYNSATGKDQPNTTDSCA